MTNNWKINYLMTNGDLFEFDKKQKHVYFRTLFKKNYMNNLKLVKIERTKDLFLISTTD